MKKIVSLLFLVSFIAAGCNSKQVLKNEPEPVAQNQITVPSTPTSSLEAINSPITKPVEAPKPVQPKATNKIVDNSAALQQAQADATAKSAADAAAQAEAQTAQQLAAAAAAQQQAAQAAEQAQQLAAQQAAQAATQAQAAMYQTQYQAVQAKVQSLQNQYSGVLSSNQNCPLSAYAGSEGIRCLLAANQAAAVAEYENAIWSDFLKPVTALSIAYENKLDALAQQIFQIKMDYAQQIANISGSAFGVSAGQGMTQVATVAANAKITAINQQIQVTLQNYQNGVAP